jgi:hypothetical protein
MGVVTTGKKVVSRVEDLVVPVARGAKKLTAREKAAQKRAREVLTARAEKKAAAAEAAAARAENVARRVDVTLPPGTRRGDPGAGPLRSSQTRRVSESREGSMAQLRDEFHDLTPNARRAEIMAGEESKFAPYIAQLYSKGSRARPVGEEAVVPSAEVVARLKGREGATSAAGMKRGGLKVKTKKAKTKEELLTQLAALDKKKKRAALRARRGNLAELTPIIRKTRMSAAKGGLMKNKHTDYRGGGMVYSTKLKRG